MYVYNLNMSCIKYQEKIKELETITEIMRKKLEEQNIKIKELETIVELNRKKIEELDTIIKRLKNYLIHDIVDSNKQYIDNKKRTM